MVASLFAAGGDFFLAAYKVQVKYEMLRRHLVEPNRASWLIWAAAAGVVSSRIGTNPGARQAVTTRVTSTVQRAYRPLL